MSGETVLTFIGNVVDDSAELRFTPSGAAVAKFRVASTARKFDKTANAWVDEQPTFLTVNVWRQQAEQVAETLSKGMRVVVVGQLKQRSYETKEGEKRTVYEIEAEDVAVSLKFATAAVTRVNRQQGQGQQAGQPQRPVAQQDPWASQAAPPQGGQGGWGAPQGQQQGGYSTEAPF